MSSNFPTCKMRHQPLRSLTIAVALCFSVALTPATAQSDRQATVADLVQEVVVQLGGVLHAQPASPSFDDVPADAWYSDYFEEAGLNGWVRGENDCYGSHPCYARPLSPLTRAIAADIVVRSYNLDALHLAPQFSDVSSSHPYHDSIQTAADNCVPPLTSSSFSPNQTVTYGDMQAILQRVLGNLRYGTNCQVPGQVSSSSSLSSQSSSFSPRANLNGWRITDVVGGDAFDPGNRVSFKVRGYEDSNRTTVMGSRWKLSYSLLFGNSVVQRGAGQFDGTWWNAWTTIPSKEGVYTFLAQLECSAADCGSQLVAQNSDLSFVVSASKTPTLRITSSDSTYEASSTVEWQVQLLLNNSRFGEPRDGWKVSGTIWKVNDRGNVSTGNPVKSTYSNSGFWYLRFQAPSEPGTYSMAVHATCKKADGCTQAEASSDVSKQFSVWKVAAKLTPSASSSSRYSVTTSLPPAGYEDEVLTNFEIYSNPFPDTRLNSLAGKAAAELYRRAVVGGFPDGTFRGAQPVNRAEAAKFLLLARYATVADAENNGRFPDVLDNQWYTKFVVTAANSGIIGGYPDGTFRPADTVNTVEFLKLLSLTFGLELNVSDNYQDVPSTSWFGPYAGITTRYHLFPNRETFLRPDADLSRDDVAIAIYQYLANRQTE